MILKSIQMKNGQKYEFNSHTCLHTPSIGVQATIASPGDEIALLPAGAMEPLPRFCGTFIGAGENPSGIIKNR